MTAPYVSWRTIKTEVKGREADIVRGLGIPWRGRDHIHCPYPGHEDRHPSWRLTERGLAICTCPAGAHNVFKVIEIMEGIDFEAAKIRAAEIIGRRDLIKNGHDEPSGAAPGLTLAEFAEHKKLPAEWLMSQGLRNGRRGVPAVRIPFHNQSGDLQTVQYRIGMGKDDKFFKKGTTCCMFGAHRAALLKEAGYAVIVEGASDTLTLWYHNLPGIGLPGATNWNEERDAPLFDGVGRIYAIIEPDDGGKILLPKLAGSAIRDRLRIIRMAAESKDPSALYLKDREKFVEKFQALLDAAEPPPPPPPEPEPPGGSQGDGVSLDDFYAVMPSHSYIFAPTRETWPAASVNSRIKPMPDGNDGNGKPKFIAASTWLDRNKPVEQLTWAPGLPEIIADKLIAEGGWIDRPGLQCFNLYRPPAIRHGDPARIKPWLHHVHYVYPNDAERIIRYCAHRVQHPGQKINHALMLGGKTGIGKDTILEPVKRAVGPWNFREISPTQMMKLPTNDYLKAVILRVSEAHDLGEFDRFTFYDRMKSYTASPPDVLRVNEKHIREYTIPNVCGVIITTNHKTDGIYLPADDRRHDVMWSNRKEEDFKQTYWGRLYAWFDRGGAENVAAYLANLDLSNFNPKAPPPKTAAFWEIVGASRTPEDAELADVIDCLNQPDIVTVSRLVSAAGNLTDFGYWLQDRKNSRRIPHRLEACGYVSIRNKDAKDGSWKIDGKRQVIYGKASMTERDRIAAAMRATGAR